MSADVSQVKTCLPVRRSVIIISTRNFCFVFVNSINIKGRLHIAIITRSLKIAFPCSAYIKDNTKTLRPTVHCCLHNLIVYKY